MANTIVTKFVIASKQGINTVMHITTTTSKEKYAGKVPDNKLEVFIRNNFSWAVIRTEMNSLWNQFLFVYADNEPAGYAKLTAGKNSTDIFNRKTVIRIADFEVLKKFNDDGIKKNLFEKCLSACRMQQIILVCEHNGNGDMGLFESYGFKRFHGIGGSGELGMETLCMVKEKDPSL